MLCNPHPFSVTYIRPHLKCGASTYMSNYLRSIQLSTCIQYSVCVCVCVCVCVLQYVSSELSPPTCAEAPCVVT